MKAISIAVIVGLFAALYVLMFTGCSTVAPQVIIQKQASLDAVADEHGNYQNSGLLGFTNHLAILTPTARARYNYLVINYGKALAMIPPLAPDDGLTLADAQTDARFHTTNLWFMDGAHFEDFATLTARAMQPKPSP